MGRAALALGAVLVLGGGAVLGYALTRKGGGDAAMTPEASAAMATAVARLDGDLKAALTGIGSKAETIAQIPVVRATMSAGDAATTDDMKAVELSFKPEPGQTIELVVEREGKPAMSILTITAGASSITPATPFRGVGTHAAIAGDDLVAIGTRAIDPQYKDTFEKEHLKGVYVTASTTLPLAPIIDPLVANGITGRLELEGATRAIGTLPANAKTTEKPLQSIPGAKLVVAAPVAKAAATSMPLVGAGAGAGALGLVVIVIGLLAGKKPAAEPGTAPTQFQTMETQPPQSTTGISPSNQMTRLSHGGVAAGTPSPVDAAGSMSMSPIIGPGALIGRWEVERRLGSGGMADVYLAHSKGEAGFEKLVAIKVMHSHLARNQRAVEHFLDEARLAARINHPNVVAIQDLGKIGNDYVIVMDYVDGVDLERLLASARTAGRPVPIDVGLGILCRICDGLHAAHNATSPDGTPLGIIHRDVKSANVLVSRQGGVKVVDFGIAKATAQAHMTIAGETKGTPSMMAPEQRVGEVVDVRADVYATAAIAYEVMTGHGVNLDLAALAHLGVENWPHLPPPSSLRPQIPPELDGILLTAMAFERDRRPANCAVFEATLEGVMKRHGFGVTDKDIARWVDNELRNLIPTQDTLMNAPRART